MTLRTGLKALDEARRLVRVHGGVKLVQAVVGTDDFLLQRAKRCVSEKAQIKRAVIGRAEHSYVLMDSGKVGMTHAFSFAVLDDIDDIVSDDGLSEEVVHACTLRARDLRRRIETREARQAHRKDRHCMPAFLG